MLLGVQQSQRLGSPLGRTIASVRLHHGRAVFPARCRERHGRSRVPKCRAFLLPLRANVCIWGRRHPLELRLGVDFGASINRAASQRRPGVPGRGRAYFRDYLDLTNSLIADPAKDFVQTVAIVVRERGALLAAPCERRPEVAGSEVTGLHLAHLRYLSAAALLGQRTACVEVAAGRPTHGTRHLARKHIGGAGALGIGHRYRVEQRLAVGMLW